GRPLEVVGDLDGDLLPALRAQRRAEVAPVEPPRLAPDTRQELGAALLRGEPEDPGAVLDAGLGERRDCQRLVEADGGRHLRRGAGAAGDEGDGGGQGEDGASTHPSTVGTRAPTPHRPRVAPGYARRRTWVSPRGDPPCRAAGS